MGRLHALVTGIMILVLVVLTIVLIEWFWLEYLIQTSGFVKPLVQMSLILLVVAGVLKYRGL